MFLLILWILNLTQKGIKQVVNAACGVDTTAWRLHLPADVTYYELDFPEVIQWKLETLKDQPYTCNYKPIGADLRRDDWDDQLKANGFDGTKKFQEMFTVEFL